MNKTVVASIGIVTCGIVCACGLYWYTNFKYLSLTGSSNDSKTMDRFTQCIQVVMSESRQSDKPVDAEKAKDICIHAKDPKAFEKSVNED